MRRTLILLVLAVFTVGFQPPVRAQSNDPSELFLSAYMAVQQAEKLEADGSAKAALSKYRFAASLLEQIQKRFPGWQELILEYRKKRTIENIVRLEQKLGEQPLAPPGPGVDTDPPLPGQEPTPFPEPVTPRSSNLDASGDLKARLDQLQRELRDSKSQLSSVQKEKEDLANQLNDVVRQLDKSKVSTAELKARLQQAEEAFQQATAANAQDGERQRAMQQQLAQMREQIAEAEAEREAADEFNSDKTRRITKVRKGSELVIKERDEVTRQRDEALTQLAEAKEAAGKVDKLLVDNAALAGKLMTAEKTIQGFNADAPKKDEQLALLRKEVSDTKMLLVAAQKENTDFKSSMAGLQDQLNTANAQLAKVQASGVTSEEKKKYTEENELLKGIVLRQLKAQAGREQAKKLVIAELQRLEVQSGTLQQQLDFLAQPVVKLTDKEKALFKEPQIEIPDADSATSMEFSIAAPKSNSPGQPDKPAPNASPTPPPNAQASPTPGDTVKLDPPAVGPIATPQPASTQPAATASSSPQVETSNVPNIPKEMLGDARAAKESFDRGDYREAEKAYEKMLAKAPNNVYLLDNLGVTHFRQGKMKLAEERFKKAIAISPEDSFSHRTLGIVYYQQRKYDESVNSLTRAIAVNSKDAISHNYLGIAASQKGWQEAALKELETAIALDPNYADAHFNLSVVYATQQPPNKELARKHYERAKALGAEPDPQLEKLIK